MPKYEKVELDPHEVANEMSFVSRALDARAKGDQKLITTQLIAVGALWYKWLSENKPGDVAHYEEIAHHIAKGVQSVIPQ